MKILAAYDLRSGDLVSFSTEHSKDHKEWLHSYGNAEFVRVSEVDLETVRDAFDVTYHQLLMCGFYGAFRGKHLLMFNHRGAKNFNEWSKGMAECNMDVRSITYDELERQYASVMERAIVTQFGEPPVVKAH